MTPEQQKLLVELEGIADQIRKEHYLNVHFRAFTLAYEAWHEHIRQNAVVGSRHVNSPAGAVGDAEDRGGG